MKYIVPIDMVIPYTYIMHILRQLRISNIQNGVL